MKKIFKENFDKCLAEIKTIILTEAITIDKEDIKTNKQIGIIRKGLISATTILTHCNVRALATLDFGTAISVIQIARDNINVKNPAFDMTHSKYITGIITEKGILKSPYNITVDSFK